MKKLYRSKKRMVGGVCAGIAEYFSDSDSETVDPTPIRLACGAIILLSGGIGILAYLMCMFIIPKEQ